MSAVNKKAGSTELVSDVRRKIRTAIQGTPQYEFRFADGHRLDPKAIRKIVGVVSEEPYGRRDWMYWGRKTVTLLNLCDLDRFRPFLHDTRTNTLLDLIALRSLRVVWQPAVLRFREPLTGREFTFDGGRLQTGCQSYTLQEWRRRGDGIIDLYYPANDHGWLRDNWQLNRDLKENLREGLAELEKLQLQTPTAKQIRQAEDELCEYLADWIGYLGSMG